jgi:hypothetical protein
MDMKTKVIFNDTIPFSGFIAMTVWPFIFVRNKAASRYNVVANNHEHIHAEQQKEMLLVGVVLAAVGYIFVGLWAILLLPVFFWWYILEWLFRICQYRNTKKAYRNISFEREAYANETNLTYNTARKRLAWTKYLHI